MAETAELPVVLHNREASVDLIPLMRSWQAGLSRSGSPLARRPGVFHSFSGTLEEASQVIKSEFLVGITGPVTFKNARELQAVVAALPLEALLIETDAPFLSPHPFRGKRNEPARVQLVAEKIAALKGVPVEIVIQRTAENADRLFNWGL